MQASTKKLKGKIIEVYGSQVAFGVAMNMKKAAVSQRINEKTPWKAPEIVKACRLLDIPLQDAYLYFFV